MFDIWQMLGGKSKCNKTTNLKTREEIEKFYFKLL